jgi:hypothetical protein
MDYNNQIRVLNHKTRNGAIFTFYSSTIREVTNIFRDTNLRITFSTNNTLQNILNTRHRDNNIYTQSGIYRMVCHTCNNSYIGQTYGKLEIRYKEHIKYIKNNNGQSAYATHILNNLHNYGPIESTVKLIHKAYEGNRINTQENYYIQYFQLHNIIQEQTTIKLNPLFQIACNMRSRDHNSDPSTDSRISPNSQSPDTLHPTYTAKNMYV